MLKSSQSLLYPDQTDEIVAANPVIEPVVWRY